MIYETSEPSSKYRNKPVVIEARQFNNDGGDYALLHWINEGQHAAGKPFAQWTNGVILIPTLEGDMTATQGDWIIKGLAGEFYPCKAEIFEQTYASVGETDAALVLTEREMKEILHSLYYATECNHGTTGHNQMLLIAKLAKRLGFAMRATTVGVGTIDPQFITQEIQIVVPEDLTVEGR